MARARTGLRGALSRYAIDPVFTRAAGARWLPTHAMLETTGRRTGLARRTPVVSRLDDDTVWLVAEYGRRAAYVGSGGAGPRARCPTTIRAPVCAACADRCSAASCAGSATSC
jgi:hypothetical protein